MSIQPIRTCEECGHQTTLKTEICFACGEKMRHRSKEGVKRVVRSIVFVLAAIYVLLSAFKSFGFWFRV